MIKVQDWIASIPEEDKHIAYVGEGMTEQREFLLCGKEWEKYQTWGFHLDMAFDATSITTRDCRQVVQTTVNNVKHTEEASVTQDAVTTKETYTVCDEEVLAYDLTDVASLDKRVEADGIHLTWTVLRQHALLPGKLRATIRAVGENPQCIKKSAMMVFEVDPTVAATPAAMPAVSQFEQMEIEMDNLRQRTVEAAEEAMRNAATAASASLGAAQAQQDAAAAAESAEDSAVSAALSAQGAVQAQQNAATEAIHAAESAAAAKSDREQAQTAADNAITAYTGAAHHADVATAKAAEATERANMASEAAVAAVLAKAEMAAAVETVNGLAADVDDLNTAVFDVQEIGVCPNLLDPNAVEYKKPYATWGEQYISAKIPAATGDAVYVKCRDESKNEVRGLYSAYFLYLYEANGTKIAARNSSFYEPVYTITNANIAYIEIGFAPDRVTQEELTDFMVTLNDEPTAFVEYWEGTTKTINRIAENAAEIERFRNTVENVATKDWQGKKVLVMGDSISADYYANYTKWVTVLKNQDYFPADTNNNSIHGTGFVATYDGDDRFVTRLAAVEDKDTYDLVVIFGGINDAISSKPMGEKGGDKNTEFKPAVDYFFDYLVNNFTQARIVVLSPLLTKATGVNSAGHRYVEYIDYIKEVAKYYCLPVLNLTEESGFCPFVESFRDMWTYDKNGEWVTGDGVHPSAEYEEKFLAPMIKNFLNQFI